MALTQKNLAPAVLALVAASAGLSVGCGWLLGSDFDKATEGTDPDGGPLGASSGTTSSGANGSSGNNSSGASGGASSGTTLPDPCTGGQVACVSGCCTPSTDRGTPNSISAGTTNTCVTTSTGQVWCWGSNYNGQLGQGSGAAIQTTNVPIRVRRVESGATKVVIGNSYICALVSGHVVCAGDNSFGELGDGSLSPSSSFQSFLALPETATDLAAGNATSCARLASGNVLCWGSNSGRQAGNDVDDRLVVPKPVTGVTTGLLVTVGQEAHACAALATGGLVCWGNNSGNRLGEAGPSLSGTPLPVRGETGVASRLSAGEYHSCAVVNGLPRCWGQNIAGEIGVDSVIGSTDGVVTPTGLADGVLDICAGYMHTCAVTKEHEVFCWGDNSQGQLGTGSAALRVPTRTTLASGLVGAPLQIACGQFHTCVLTDAAQVQCWGGNAYGVVGAGTTASTEPLPKIVTLD